MKHRPMGFHAKPVRLTLQEIKEQAELEVDSRYALGGTVHAEKEYYLGQGWEKKTLVLPNPKPKLP